MENRWKRLLVIGILVTGLMTFWRQEITMNTAWWGTLYPKYCYSQIPTDSDGEQVQIRIKFRWLHGL